VDLDPLPQVEDSRPPESPTDDGAPDGGEPMPTGGESDPGSGGR
jgi:hypothetical protein